MTISSHNNVCKWCIERNSFFFLGTSNWSADYFIDTGGVGVIVNSTDDSWSEEDAPGVWEQLADVFERDWNSGYAWKNFTSTMYSSHTRKPYLKELQRHYANVLKKQKVIMNNEL